MRFCLIVLHADRITVQDLFHEQMLFTRKRCGNLVLNESVWSNEGRYFSTLANTLAAVVAIAEKLDKDITRA